MTHDDLLRLLMDVSEKFTAYANHYLIKHPPDFDKVIDNVKWAKRCYEAAKQGAQR